MLAVTDFSGDLVEKHKSDANMLDFGMILIWILFKNSVFIHISAFFYGRVLVWVREKIIFV
jgi:hypothetical protein